jgi:hypothetical protein
MRCRGLREQNSHSCSGAKNITSQGCTHYGLAPRAVKSNANFMVIWTDGKIRTYVEEMYDKPRGLCKWWIEQHKHEPRFSGGKLLVISVMRGRAS